MGNSLCSYTLYLFAEYHAGDIGIFAVEAGKNPDNDQRYDTGKKRRLLGLSGSGTYIRYERHNNKNALDIDGDGYRRERVPYGENRNADMDDGEPEDRAL